MTTVLALSGCLGTTLQPPDTRPVDLAMPPPELTRPTLGSEDARALAPPAIDVAGYSYLKKEGQDVSSFPSAGTLNLTVEQAVLSALGRNRELVVEQFNPMIAGTFVDTERAVFDSVLFSRGSLDHDSDRFFDAAADRFFSINGDRSTIRAGVARRLITGTDVSLDITQTSSTRNNARDEARAGLNLTQALLRNAGVATNLAGIRRAEAGALASAYKLRGFTENLVATVENGYWDYALAVRQLEIFQESLDLAQRQLNDIQTRITVGQLAEIEETVADAELALRKQQLIDARNVRERARLNLLRLLNPLSAEGWDRQITLSEDAVVPEVSLGSVLEHEALAIRLRPDLNEARLQARSGELETVQTANGLLPRLDLFITFGKTGYAQSFGRSFRDLSGPGYDVAVGLDFEFPVENRAAKALDRRARASYQQALHSIENLKQLVSLDVRNALLEVERSLQQIDASAARRVLQEEVLRAETVRFGVGATTTLEVARVQRDLLESRISEVEAVVNYRQALINLYLLDGTLLLRHGIQGPGAEEVVL
ncbi:MAG: TolC family protein [Desulfoarculaceae bacterium]|nr:TolC family protein [Desulfoarculaceae bacterium]